ncbi:hypothetical protein BDW02DRAFT_626740 [Decorospora gaudefroyi]|uniref:Secreted protein n=1 Tax=Decorospora gaudefroyi TaxID=184978 RepID=A0A6A5KYN2_9PLEO|nr:hypothetical protein BDW02DRAFT_626740 [Decorospora gaudefroyi]
MTVFKSLSVIAAVSIAVCSTSIPPPEDLCKLGTQRCHNNQIQECNTHGSYKLVQKCTWAEFCTIDVNGPNARGQCLPQDCIQGPCSTTPTHKPVPRAPLQAKCEPNRTREKNCIQPGSGRCVRNVPHRHDIVERCNPYRK